MERKEDIKELFFNYATKHWRFEEIIKRAGLSRAQTNEWLKRLIKEDLIKRISNKGKMPYYIANYMSSKYKIEKKMYAFHIFNKVGFLSHLSSLKAKTVILFGSFARSDWHEKSDIDIFIYGNADDFNKGYYEKILKREIQVFNYKDKKSLKRLEPAVFPNILSGLHIRGEIKPFKVIINA